MDLCLSAGVFMGFLVFDLFSHNTKAAIIMGSLIVFEMIAVFIVWRCKTKEEVLEKQRQEFELYKSQWNEAVEKAGEINQEDLPKYNGGMTHVKLSGEFEEKLGLKPLVLRLPIPDDGMKWAMRLRDTKDGDILPDLVQVPKDEETSGWKEGYTKYE